MKNLTGKTCLIADASEAVGKDVSLYLAKQGAKLVLCFDKDVKIDNQLVQQLEEIKAIYKVIVNDFSSYEEASKIVKEVENDNNFVSIDSMYYNIIPKVVRQTVSDMPRKVLQDLIENYILKAYTATKIIGDAISKKGGTIVYRGSINADKPTGIAGFNSMYYAAIKNLNREAALYYGSYHVRTASIEFGATGKEDEEYHNDISTFYDGYKYKVPSGYIGTGDDFGSLIAYLISDECLYINGADIRVDGGLLFQYIEAVINISAHKRLERDGKEYE